MKNKRLVILSLLSILTPFLTHASFDPLDINSNGVLDSVEQEVVIDTNISLPAGEYFFNDLKIINGATLYLVSDPNSSQTFKGVKLNAKNICIDIDSSISGSRTGYPYLTGPGASTFYGLLEYLYGGSYGGEGQLMPATSTYGSALRPTDLGSGGYYGRGKGGGAVWLVVSGELKNDGSVSSDGGETSSGGSILIDTDVVSGSGEFSANGGITYCPNICYGPGGGGRIAIYYNNNNFSGKALADGYSGYGGSSKSGTVGFVDKINNNLMVISDWKFELVDSPIIFNKIFLKNNSRTLANPNVVLYADDIYVDSSYFEIKNNQDLNIKNIFIENNSKVSVFGFGSIKFDSLNILTGGLLKSEPERILYLLGSTINIDSHSQISVNGSGYASGFGYGAPFTSSYFGASYGGVGWMNTSTSTYGSDTEPVDFGSGGNGYHTAGGGAIKIETRRLKNDGIISADGFNTSSGGSIYVLADDIFGAGLFSAYGGTIYCPNICYGPGGGGRIAVYYDSNNFSGKLEANGQKTFIGDSGDGTVVFKEKSKCKVNCNSNVVFIPGVLGSRLYEDSNGTETELWVSTNDNNHSKLALDTNGKSVNNLYTKTDNAGIVDEIYFLNVYKTFLSDLASWKNQDLYENYAVIPYDWRVSLEDIIDNGATTTNGRIYYGNPSSNSSFIMNTLRDLVKTSRNGKVIIVAHSNGGLVAKALLAKLKQDNDPLYNQIEKIILVAVPQVGTPEAVLDILHGTNIGFAGGVMIDERLRDLSLNMQTAYNLLPSNAYFSTVDPAYAVDKLASFQFDPNLDIYTKKYGSYISNPTEFEDFMLGNEGRTKPSYTDTKNLAIGNSNLYDKAKFIHSLIDFWMPAASTKVIQVAGWGEETIAGIDYSVKGGIITFTPRKVIDGDGVVITPSALWMSTSSPNVERWWINLDIYNKNKFSNSVHRNILEISNILNLIKSNITDLPFQSDSVITDDPKDLVTSGKRLHYILHSPLTLGVYDSQNRYTGLDPVTKTIKNEIPGSRYEEYGDVKFLSLPDDVSHTVKLVGYDNGLFSLDIEKQDGNIVVENTSFEGFSSSKTTVVEIDSTASQPIAISTMKIDNNNDGLADIVVKAKVGSVVLPPKPLSVYADSKNIILGAPMPDLTSKIKGFLEGDSVENSISGKPLCSTVVSTTNFVGKYSIDCILGTLISDKYYFDDFISGVMSISYKFDGFDFGREKENKENLIFKAGSNVSIKFKLKNYYNKKVLANSLPEFLTPQIGQKIKDRNNDYQYITPTTTLGTFKVEHSEKEYQYNWKTKGLKAGYWYKIYIKLDDGNIYSTIIGLK